MKKRLSILKTFVLVFTLFLSLISCNGNDHSDRLQSNGITIEGHFKSGMALVAERFNEDDSVYNSVMDRIAEKNHNKDKVAVYDISLEKDHEKVQPDGKVRITMEAPFKVEGSYVTYHIHGNAVEDLATSFENGRISFETDRFSYFVISETGSNTTVPDKPENNFFAFVDTFEQATMTADGKEVKKEGYATSLKAGDSVELSATANTGYKMLGWFKDSKDSGNSDQYPQNGNSATFVYQGIDKMYVYARFDVIEYSISVDLNGGTLKEGDSIPTTYNVESETISLPTPEKETMTFVGWKDNDGKIINEIAKGSHGDINLTATWKGPAYVLVDKNRNPDENGGYILFGNYPQTAVNRYDTTKKTALKSKAGELPVNGNNGKWTSYRYPYAKVLSDEKTEMSDEIDFMWYIDVGYEGETYRGVYFTHYRPNNVIGTYNTLVDKTSSEMRQQKFNKYYAEEIYWFKIEPILWKILRKEEGRMQLLCMSALNAQPYTLLAEKGKEMVKDENDSHYLYYNTTPGVKKDTLATNYEYSFIRHWLNNGFLEDAFGMDEKKMLCETKLDNVDCEVGNDTVDKIFIPSLNDIKDIHSELDRKATDYAQVQGVETDYANVWCSHWYIRESYYVLKYNDKKNLIAYDKDRYKQVVSINGGILFDPPGFTPVNAMTNGIVPSLWINL